MLKQNVGIGDMITRLVVGSGLIYLGAIDQTIMTTDLSRNIIVTIALVPLITGLLRFCPLFALLGSSTKPVEMGITNEEY